jgi:glycosyltransferase involved in cell wall biosynthesis
MSAEQIVDHLPPASVIICAYNAEKDIRDTLNSLIAQTYDNLEILIVDDASTDGTPAICRAYAERNSRVRYVRHPENRGIAHTRKTGVEQASHELLTFIDSDDIAMPHMVETLVREMLIDDARLGVSAFRIYFDDTRDLGVQKIGPTSREAYNQLYSRNKLIFLSFPNLVRKADVLRAGGFRVDILPNATGIRYADFCEDLDLWCRMSDFSAEGRYFIALTEPLSKYRKPADSLSTKNLRQMQNKMRWIKDCLLSRRSAQPERSLADFLESRRRLDRILDWFADNGAELYKRAGFAYSHRNYGRLALFLLLAVCVSPKLICHKLKTQRIW